MNTKTRWFDYITHNIYWLGLTALSQTMSPLVVPLLVQQFVGEAQKGTYYGSLRLWQLMVAILVQALMGMLSDRSNHRMGRRRPFILLGTLGDILVIVFIGLSAGMTGMNGYWFLFTMILVLMVATNTAHGAQQGLIPDLVPLENRGKFSAVKAILEIPIPIILVGFTIGNLIKAGNLWGGLIVLIIILLVTAGITMLVPEKRLDQPPAKIDWAPILRLALMTATFLLVILVLGEAVPWVDRLLSESSGALYLISMGIAGLLAMGLATFLGVYASIWIGLGKFQKKSTSFTWWVINRLSFLVGTTNLVSFVVYFLQGRLGLKGAEAAGPASQLSIFVGAFILISALPSGWLADRYGRKTIAALSAIIAAIGTVFIIVVPNLTVIYLGGCLVGIASGLFYTANWALGTEIVPKDEAGKYLGISNLAGAGAGAIGAYIGGPIADLITTKYLGFPAAGYIILFSIYGVLFLLSLVALFKIKQEKTPGLGL